MNLKTEITDSDLYQSGMAFTPKEMVKHLVTADRQKVIQALYTLRDEGDALYDGIRYWKPQRHWINGIRLANPVEGVNA